MAWKGVITNAGAELMTRWTADSTLKLSSAYGGTGTVEEVALMAQEILVDPKQQASIISGEAVEGGTRIQVQLVTHDESYTLNQIGLFASLGDEVPVLIALYQNSDGVLIPSNTESKDFVYTFFCTLNISNQGQIEITIDPAALVSHKTLEEAIAAHGVDTTTHKDIHDLIDYHAAKIGDIRISTRDFADDSWLLCPNMNVNEDNYPELYYILAAKTDIFTGEWALATNINTLGVAPIYATDSSGNDYVYFVEDGTSTVYRYNLDLTEMHTFNRLKSGKVQYENGLWFIFGSGDNFGTVYYSSDCFETELNELKFSSSGSDESAESSFVRYTGGEWYICLCYNNNYNFFDMYRSAEINGEYSEVNGTSSIYDAYTMYPTDKVMFSNGATLMAFRYSATTNGVTYRRKRLYYNPSSDAYSNSNWKDIGLVDSRHVTYLQDIDAVIYNDKNVISTLLKNDGTTINLGHTFLSVAYFKGFLYLKTENSIYRYDANALDQEPVVKTKCVTEYGISASSLRLYMPNGTDSVYYIENDKSLSIPEAHPDSIFKTYIKAK